MKISSIKSQLSGEVHVPGSKSHTIRALILASMAKGKSTVISPLMSQDTISCLKACQKLGADIKIYDQMPPTKLFITGMNGSPSPKQNFLDMGNSGTSLRLLTSIASLCDQIITFDGDESLRTRPMNILLDALNDLGVNTQSNNNKCPLTIKGPFKGGSTQIKGTSSQFLSALLITSPFAKHETNIHVTDLNEKPYVDITLDWLKETGLHVHYSDYSHFTIPPNQTAKAFDKQIPADFSTACFPLCAAAVTKSKICIKGLDFTDSQGDKMVFDKLQKMGVEISIVDDQCIINAQHSELKGIDIDLNQAPDALPILSVIGCFAKGTTRILNVPQARIKECDRIHVMVSELTKMGAKIEELEDGLIIHESDLTGTLVNGHHDHRVIMALTIAGMNSSFETVIDQAEGFEVTYPQFIHHFKNLGANIDIIID